MWWPLERRRGRPGGGQPSSKFIGADSNDNSNHSLDIEVSQLVSRPVRSDEIPELRAMWWRQVALGHRLPAELGVIVLEGGCRG